MLSRVRPWIRSLVLRRRLEREMQEEMADHIERSTERLVARGLSAEEARREALREFGNVAYLQEEARDARGARWVDALAGDLRFALRRFARKPGTTATMFVVLAVGMSIATLLFSYVYSYAVQPPAGVALADDLVRIRGSRTAGVDGLGSRAFSEEEFLGYRELTGPFSAVAGWTDTRVVLDPGTGPERGGVEAKVTFVTDDYFPVLGVRPVLGAGLPRSAPGDPATAAVGVISHAAWDQLFGRDPGVIGSTLTVNGAPVTVVGVAPPRFVGMTALEPFTVWMPLAARRSLVGETPGEFRAVGRLRPGVTRPAASAAARSVAARTAEADAELRALEPSTDVVPLLAANGDPMFDRDVRLMSFLVGLLGLLVLLVTCTNVSALLTGLAAARRQEIAIRLSLGAARTRLIRQLLTESALLASAAGAAALGIVWLVLRAASRLVPTMPFDMGIEWPVAAFTFGSALAVGVGFGLSPALHATRLAVASALRDSAASITATRARLQRGLVVAQIAFTQPLVALLAAVLLLVVSEYTPRSRTEFADRLVTLSLRAPAQGAGVAPDSAGARWQLRAAMDRLVERLRTTPGVEAAMVTWGSTPPLGTYRVHPDDRVPGGAGDAVRLSGETAAGGYFEVMGIPVVRGREFGEGEVGPAEPRNAEVGVVVGADLARRLWAGADPVGRRLQAASDTASGARTLAVVGVIDDPLAAKRGAGEAFRVYLPPDTGRTTPALLVRTAGAALPLLPAIHQVAREEAPGMGARIRTLGEVEEAERRTFRMVAGGVSSAGLMALLLSAIGLYAVVAFSVGQRTREIAVRIAVGARGRQIVRRFVADGLRLSAFGLVLGLPASLVGLHLLLSADDDLRVVSLPAVTAMAAVGVVLVATAAAWIPARRAAAVDPAVTLRTG
jgi:predicted permease